MDKINSKPSNNSNACVSNRQLCEVSIHFDTRKLDVHKLQQIENLFIELGITFDSGGGKGTRDWEWDWSLEGPVTVEFRKMKDSPK